jgi:hypothetical protein
VLDLDGGLQMRRAGIMSVLRIERAGFTDGTVDQLGCCDPSPFFRRSAPSDMRWSRQTTWLRLAGSGRSRRGDAGLMRTQSRS